MKKLLLINLLTAILFLWISGVAIAALIDHGSSTRDTDTNLDWLDLTLTQGITIAEIMNNTGGWWSNGWRIATTSEVDNLIGGFLGIPALTDVLAAADEALALIGLFGETYDNSNGSSVSQGQFFSGLLESSTSLNDIGIGWFEARRMGMVGSVETYGVWNTQEYWNNSLLNNQDLSTRGTFLVRSYLSPVPEPATMLLFGLGLLGPAGVNRRRK